MHADQIRSPTRRPWSFVELVALWEVLQDVRHAWDSVVSFKHVLAKIAKGHTWTISFQVFGNSFADFGSVVCLGFTCSDYMT